MTDRFEFNSSGNVIDHCCNAILNKNEILDQLNIQSNKINELSTENRQLKKEIRQLKLESDNSPNEEIYTTSKNPMRFVG